jgi:hypothetical protein
MHQKIGASSDSQDRWRRGEGAAARTIRLATLGSQSSRLTKLRPAERNPFQVVEKSKRLPVLAEVLKQTEAQRNGAAAAKDLAGGKRRAQRARVVALATVEPCQLRDTQVQDASTAEAAAMPRGLHQAPWSLAQALQSVGHAPLRLLRGRDCPHTQAEAELNMLPDIEVGEEERMVQVGGQEERVGEAEGLGVGEDKGEGMGVGLIDEDDVDVEEEPISRYGRGGRGLKKPAKYT